MMYGPPTLLLHSKVINKKDSGYEATLQFKPSNNSDVPGYKFIARVIDGNATIVSFIGVGVGNSPNISDDRKSGVVHFKPLAGYPTIVIVVTACGVVELIGSHLDQKYRLEMQ